MIGPQGSPRSYAESMQRIFIFVLAIAAFALCLSYSVEYFFHQVPCKLCKIQRTPYFLLIAGSFLGFYTHKKRLLLRILQAILVMCCLVACFHSAVVFGLVKDPCLVNPKLDDIESFKAALMQSQPCSTSVWELLGIPIPVFNAALLISLAIAIEVVVKRKMESMKLLKINA